MLRLEEWMDIKDLYRQGHSIREIARVTGRCRKTVRLVLRQKAPSPYKQPPRASKLDPFKPYLAQRYEACSLSGVRLTQEIQAMGFDGSVDIVQRYLRTLAADRRTQQRATVRFETPPGQQAQVDWAHCGKLGDQSVYAFLMVLGFSRMLYVEFTLSMDLPTLLQCHKNAFAYLGGWTQTLLYDNMKQVKLGPDQFHPLFLDFAHYYGFTPKTHRIRRPRTKGKVERMVDYLKESFLKGRSFADLADMNAQGRHWLDNTANVRLHATTGQRPVDLWHQEGLTALASLPEYPLHAIAARKVDAEGFVRLGGSRYSVPPAHVGQTVTLLHLGQKVLVRAGDLVVAEHACAPKPGSCMADPAHLAELWKLSTRVSPPSAPLAWQQTEPVVEVRSLTIYEEAV